MHGMNIEPFFFGFKILNNAPIHFGFILLLSSFFILVSILYYLLTPVAFLFIVLKSK